MSVLIDNIGQLVTCDPTLGTGPLGLIENAALVLGDDGTVTWAGARSQTPQGAAAERFDATGRAVIPGFVDSHAHLVFAGDRAAEFAARMAGRPYTAGGIRVTVGATRAASDEQLDAGVARLVTEALRSGTTTIECKSGYGLTVDDEARSLRIAGRHTTEVTYLGAHVVSPDYSDRPDEYVQLVCGAMLDACAPHAKWIDVFCARGAFDADQSRAVLKAGQERGLGARIHANQLGHGPGVQIACELGAASADHVSHTTDADVRALADSGTVATLLPVAEFSTRVPYPDARRLLDAGVTVALAADCNPGTAYSTNIPFCIALAVREMGLTVDEAVWAATRGGAAALQRTDIGHLAPGARADAVLLDAPSHLHLAYRPGVPMVSAVWREGVRVV
jgi:imidazolonepropionase